MNNLLLPKEYTVYVKPSDLEISQRKLNGYRKHAEIIQWGRRNPIAFCKDFFGIELLDYQAWIFMSSWTTPMVLWDTTRGGGKMLDLNTRIPTPDGDVQLKDLKVGDYVFDEKGNPTKILHMSPIDYTPESYNVTFSDGEVIKACADHLWRVRKYGKSKVLTTKEMSKKYYNIRHQKDRKDGKNRQPFFTEYIYRVDMCEPLQYEKKDLPIHPYILGLWLGNGEQHGGRIYLNDNYLDDYINAIQSVGYKVYSIIPKSEGGHGVAVVVHNENNQSILPSLQQLGLDKEKDIPNNYQYSCIEDRLMLLQGLCDSDGAVDHTGKVEFCQSITHKTLVMNFCKLLDSLGIKHGINTCNRTCQTGTFLAYRIFFKSSKQFPAVKVAYKFKRLKNNIPIASTRKSIIKIEQCKPVPMRCIQVASPSHLYLCGEKNTVTHNSTIDAVFLMAKTLLFNNYKTVICSGTAAQSIETFQKLESIALKQLASFTGLTDFYVDSVVKNNNSNGFIHNPMGFTTTLYNGSNIKTVNSSIDTQRGKRCNLLILDEGGFMNEEMIAVYGAFTTVESGFKLGGDINLDAIPREVPNQILFTSSASAVGTPFWKRYREFSKRMIMGDDRYFCAHINADVVINATFHGETYPVPLLSRETVDQALRTSREKGLREYYGIFMQEGNANQIIRRQWIARNSITMIPELFNIDNESEYVLCYDSARSNDNSFILVGKYIYDDTKGWKVQIVNGINFADLGLRKRTPMRLPEQIKAIRRLWLDYNGKNPEYSKFEMYSDGGSGGSGNTIPDFLMEDWFEEGHEGDPDYMHPGIIDKEYSKEYLGRFRNAKKNLHVIQPNQYKSIMYESLIQNVENDLIIFPEEYDHHGYLNLLDIDEEKIKKIKRQLSSEGLSEQSIEMKLAEADTAKTRIYKLSLEEEVALTQIDMMKEEVVNICRFKTEGAKDRFALPAHKEDGLGVSESTLHDDRSYTLALLSYALSIKRNDARLKKFGRNKHSDIVSILPMKRGNIRRMIG